MQFAVGSAPSPLACSCLCICNILGAGARGEGLVSLVSFRSFLKPVSFVYLLGLADFLQFRGNCCATLRDDLEFLTPACVSQGWHYRYASPTRGLHSIFIIQNGDMLCSKAFFFSLETGSLCVV